MIKINVLENCVQYGIITRKWL